MSRYLARHTLCLRSNAGERPELWLDSYVSRLRMAPQPSVNAALSAAHRLTMIWANEMLIASLEAKIATNEAELAEIVAPLDGDRP